MSARYDIDDDSSFALLMIALSVLIFLVVRYSERSRSE
jgi:hypothetical protein